MAARVFLAGGAVSFCALPVFAQLPPSPESRAIVYPGPPRYPAPPPLRFETVWEQPLPGGAAPEIRASGSLLIVHAGEGPPLAFDAATGAPAELLRVEAPEGGGPDGGRAAVLRDGEVCLERAGRKKPEWCVSAGTDFGTPPVSLTTHPGPDAARRSLFPVAPAPGRSPRAHPRDVIVAGTVDGLLRGYNPPDGQLLWSARASARLERPIGVLADTSDPGADQTRLLVAGVGSRRLEAFRAVDGLAAGSLVLEPEEASILSGPIVTRAGAVAFIWSAHAPTGASLRVVRAASGTK